MMKPFLILISLFSLSCKEDNSKQTQNISNSQKTNVEINKSFVISCGSGCALTYTAENILQNDDTSIKVKFKVEMHTDEKLSDSYYENYLFSYDKNKEIEKITIEGKNENILSNLMPDAQDSFREFAAEIINRSIHVSQQKGKPANKTDLSTAKSCEFKNLSNKYKFILEAEEYKNEKEQKYPTSAWIIVTNKKNGKSQEIHYEPNSWTSYQDLPCTNFFVKDFNFDDLEDFAIVWDQGGVEKLYEYYLQDKNGNFSAVETFPLQHGILAENIDVANKTITTQSIIGCCHININKYKLNSNTTWDISSEQQELKKK
ncbi:hypothetical protein REB14_03905 [Chryseobacterium sp. ES2]|uniref:Lipoprotein n=1 Tax=Chryseobacterium metallicongregator TaxID=3073042 RepID=A0ABU1E109_9FLAO|nr:MULTISPECIES: hypothetical protein [Chryseobacterium]MDR4951331.1 hypothetical protein [Chryseobacterium sp. ES2]